MSRVEAIAELFAGLVGACFGVLLIYQARHPEVHPRFRTCWTKYSEETRAMNKSMCGVAGTDFFPVGMPAQSIRELLQ